MFDTTWYTKSDIEGRNVGENEVSSLLVPYGY